MRRFTSGIWRRNNSTGFWGSHPNGSAWVRGTVCALAIPTPVPVVPTGAKGQGYPGGQPTMTPWTSTTCPTHA